MKFDNLLATFKSMENEYMENILVLAEDAGLRTGLLGWQSMDVDYAPELECPEEVKNEKQQWSWMWSVIKFDYKRFSIVANVKEYDAMPLIERLKALRMIYPDGTANISARKFLREQVTSYRPGWQIKLKHQLKSQDQQDEKSKSDS